MVEVTFANGKARTEFERAWRSRVGEPVDKIRNGVQYTGDNAERALDIANEVLGVKCHVY